MSASFAGHGQDLTEVHRYLLSNLGWSSTKVARSVLVYKHIEAGIASCFLRLHGHSFVRPSLELKDV